MDLGDAGAGARFVLHDRDAPFTQAFDAVFQAAGTRVSRSAVQAPRMNTHRPHRTLNQAAPLRPLPDEVTDLDQFRVRRRDRAGSVIHEYRLMA